MADLIGAAAEFVLTGIDKLWRSSRADSLQSELDATPSELEEQRLQPYHYEAQRYEAGRNGELLVTLVDRPGGTAWQTISRISETRQFRIDSNRRATDARERRPPTACRR